MEGGAPHDAGGRTKTDLRRGRLSTIAPRAEGKTERGTTNVEQDFLLGETATPSSLNETPATQKAP